MHPAVEILLKLPRSERAEIVNALWDDLHDRASQPTQPSFEEIAETRLMELRLSPEKSLTRGCPTVWK